jgi:hypothetical protein
MLNITFTDDDISFSINEQEQDPEDPPEYWNFVGTVNQAGNHMSGNFASTGTSSENGTWSATKQ